jgi:hypothetical protein
MIASGIRAPITGKVWDQYQHGWGGNAGPADTGPTSISTRSLEARSVAALESTGQELGIVFIDRVPAGTE